MAQWRYLHLDPQIDRSRIQKKTETLAPMIRTYNWSLLSIRLAHTDTVFFLWKDDGDRNSNADTAASIAAWCEARRLAASRVWNHSGSQPREFPWISKHLGNIQTLLQCSYAGPSKRGSHSQKVLEDDVWSFTSSLAIILGKQWPFLSGRSWLYDMMLYDVIC